MVTPEIASNALAFLVRADLKGAEVPAYMEVFNALQAIANLKRPATDAKLDAAPKKKRGT